MGLISFPLCFAFPPSCSLDNTIDAPPWSLLRVTTSIRASSMMSVTAFEGLPRRERIPFAGQSYIQTLSPTCASSSRDFLWSTIWYACNSNNWDAMFMEHVMGSIIIHKPVALPAVVLSLGNDFDFWAIQATQRWHVCIQLLTLWVARILTLWAVAPHCRNAELLHIVCLGCTRTEWTLSFGHWGSLVVWHTFAEIHRVSFSYS